MRLVLHDHFESLGRPGDLFDLLANHILLKENIYELGYFDACINFTGLVPIIWYQTSIEVLACFSDLSSYRAVDSTHCVVFLVYKVLIDIRLPITDTVLGWAY